MDKYNLQVAYKYALKKLRDGYPELTDTLIEQYCQKFVDELVKKGIHAAENNSQYRETPAEEVQNQLNVYVYRCYLFEAHRALTIAGKL